MATKSIYRGFSSFEYAKNRTFQLTGIELVKMDLLNHIFTRRTERVMMPRFGTLIPELTFEPLDQETVELIEDELLIVFNYDPRVELIELFVTPDYPNNSITVQSNLEFIELNTADDFNFNIEFEAQ